MAAFAPGHSTPGSCDFLGLVSAETETPAADLASAVAGGLFLVWLIDDRDTVVVRAASTLSG